MNPTEPTKRPTPSTKTLRQRWFGPSKDEIWRQLADELHAEFTKSGFAKGSKVQGSHGGWTILLDTYVQVVSTGKTTTAIPYTRVRARFASDCDLHLTVRRKGLFTKLAKLLGMQDITVGFEPFDEEFVIKGRNEERIRELFADATVRELLAKQPKVHLSVRPHKGALSKELATGVNELKYLAVGHIKDIDRLKALYDLFAATLARLSQIRCAHPLPPGTAPF